AACAPRDRARDSLAESRRVRSLVRGGFSPSQADPRRDAHILSVHVHYRWHPLHGRVLPVCGAHCAAGERCYVVTLADGTKTHLPVWMTELDAEGDASLADHPFASIAALEAVRALVDTRLDET